MANKRWELVALALVVFVVSGLACGPKTTPVPQVPPPTVTPYVPATTSPQDPQSSPPPPPPPPQTPGTAPQATPSSESPEPTVAPQPTATQPPPPPPATPQPTAEPTQPAPGAPLVITDPGYNLEGWQNVGPGQWEAYVSVTFTGGVAPYTFALEHSTPQSENYLTMYSAKECGGEPVRVDVWSADGQHAYRDIWVVIPWCP